MSYYITALRLRDLLASNGIISQSAAVSVPSMLLCLDCSSSSSLLTAGEILSLLKGKGVASVCVVLQNACNRLGGISRRAGGEEELENLCSRCEGYGYTLCLPYGDLSEKKRSEYLSVGIELYCESEGDGGAVSDFSCIDSLNGAAMLTGLPAAAESDSDICESIPFLNACFRGVCSLSGDYVNTEGIPLINLLSCMEYGTAPSVYWSCDEANEYYYENTFSVVADFMAEACADLLALQLSDISSHTLLQEGVYCTCFSYKSPVYVNYNNYSVNIGTVQVQPYSYLKIN